MSAWYDSGKTKQEVMNIKVFEHLEHAVGTWGLSGLDRLLSFMIVEKLQTFQRFIHNVTCDDGWQNMFLTLNDILAPLTSLVGKLSKRL